MGLDMYAYVATKKGQQNEFYEGAEYDKESGNFVNKSVAQPRELAYWRKHPNLHGWMQRLWERRRVDESLGNIFNGVELELSWEELDELELAVTHGQLPGTTGFFFGEDADDHYREQDLQFIRDAKAEIFCGLRVFYNSSW